MLSSNNRIIGKTLFLVATLCTAVSIVRGQEQPSGTAFSLPQAIEYAMENSPVADNAQRDFEIAVHKKKEVAGLGYPQLTASADLKNYIEIPTSLIPGDFVGMPGTFIPVKFGTKYNATAGINGSQLLFSSDYIFALKASSAFIELSRISVERTKTELAAQVSKAYYSVIISRDRLKLLDANVARLKKVLDDTKAFNREGLVEQIDVERLEVQYNNLVTIREQTIKLIGLSETMLKFQIGYDLSKPVTLTDSLVFDETQFQEIPTGRVDLSKRPDYRLLQTQQKLLEIDAKRFAWGYLPSLVAYGAFQYNTQRQKPDFFDFEKNNPLKQWYRIGLIGATLNFTIFDGFQRHHKIQQAKLASAKSQNDMRNLELAGELEATMAAITYNNAYATLLVQKKNMDLAENVHKTAQIKFENGIGSNLEVVNAEADLQQAQTSYFNAVYEMLIAKIDYQKATGTILK